MPPSDSPNLAEILEREALFEKHIFKQKKIKKKKEKENCKEMLDEKSMHYQDAF